MTSIYQPAPHLTFYEAMGRFQSEINNCLNRGNPAAAQQTRDAREAFIKRYGGKMLYGETIEQFDARVGP